MAISAQRNEIRKIVIYLMKKQSSASNQEIGETVGDMSGFAVAKSYQRLRAEIGKDEALRREVEKLADSLSRVKG